MIRKPNFKLNWKYAIGEIALIFIGISLAIAFQNWNDKRIEEKELSSYLEKIATNVKADRVELEELTNFRDSSRLGATLFVEITQKEKVDSTDILTYFDVYGQYFAFFDVYFNGNQSGFEALKSAGFLNKLHDTQIENALFKYYDLHSEIKIQEKSLNDFIESLETELFKANVIQELIPLVSRRLTHKNDVMMVHQLMKSPSFSGVNYRVSSVNTMQELYLEAMLTGDSLLLAIQNFNR